MDSNVYTQIGLIMPARGHELGFWRGKCARGRRCEPVYIIR